MRNKTQGNTIDFVRPVTIDDSLRMSKQIPTQNSSSSNPQKHFASSINEEYNRLPAGISVPIQFNDTKYQQERQQQQIQVSSAFEQHRKFLENYKKERGEEIKLIRDQFFANHLNSSTLVQQQNEDQEQSQGSQKAKQQQNNPLLDAVSKKLQEIHKKINRQILSQNENDQSRRFKVFDGAVSTKNDLERIAKQRRFIRSQTQKYQYKEPEMPPRHLMPIKYRINSHSFTDEADLCQKARDFIEKVHREQQNLLGKQIIRKKKEDHKKLVELKQEQKRSQQLEQIKKQERRLKAEQNLQLMKEKLKINKIVNRNSIQQLRKILAEKQQRLQSMQMSIKDSEKEVKFIKHKTISDKLERRGKTSSISEYSQQQRYDLKPRDKELKISIDKLKKLKQTQTNIRAKLKIGIKKHKLIRPTQYHQSNQQRQKIESRLKTDYVENSSFLRQQNHPEYEQKQYNNTQFSRCLKKTSRSITSKENQEKLQFITQNSNSIPVSEPSNGGLQIGKNKQYAQFQDNTFGLTKQGRKSIAQNKIYPSSSLS